jgi:hypothetical protein
MYKHPLVATLLLSFLSLTALATDRYVDPSIWPATLPANYYMTVTQALNAAQSGDRIFIAPGAYATPAITLSQNIEIYSMDTTDVVQLYTGNLSTGTPITMNGTANMQVKMSGFSCGAITINGATDMQVQIWKINSTGALSLYSAANMNLKFWNSTSTSMSINATTSNMNIQAWKVNTGSVSIAGGDNLTVQMDSIISNSNFDINCSAYTNCSIKLSNSQYANLTLNAGQNMILDATKLNVTSNINVSGALGSRFTFANCTATNLSSTSCNATANSRAKINLIDCVFSSNLNIDHDNFLLNCIQTRIIGNTLFRYGNFITSRTNNLTVANENGLVDTVNKILVAADTVDAIFNYSNDKTRFVIANNLLNKLQIAKWLGNNTITNKIINNEFTGSSQLLNIPGYNVPYYNIDVSNNILPSNVYISGGRTCYIWGSSGCPAYNASGCNPYPPFSGGTGLSSGDIRSYSSIFDEAQSQNYYCYFYTNCWGWNNYWYYFAGPQLTSSSVNDCAFPNRDVPGFFKWTYNGFSIPGTGSLPGNLTFINTPGTSNTVNAGNPAAEYTDIDLSRNDRGRLGGPYSILNYNPANPNNSKAFIFDLDIPTQFNPTSPSVNIQAKGYHRN